MVYLKFYTKELKLFKREYRLKVNSKNQIIKITNKICRHYKLPKLKVRFAKNDKQKRSSYCYTYNLKVIKFPKFETHKINIGIIVHELSHHLEYTKKGYTKHNKSLMSIIKRIHKYCEKKDYWNYITDLNQKEI